MFIRAAGDFTSGQVFFADGFNGEMSIESDTKHDSHLAESVEDQGQGRQPGRDVVMAFHVLENRGYLGYQRRIIVFLAFWMQSIRRLTPRGSDNRGFLGVEGFRGRAIRFRGG